MGKKVAVASTTKISKNEKQLHSLIKVLRPKVYITDRSSFKQLVQELTGNRTQISTSKQPEEEVLLEKVDIPIIEINDDQGEIPNASTTFSMDSSFCSFESCDLQTYQPEEMNQLTAMMQTANHDHHISMFDDHHVSMLTNYQQLTDWSTYQNLESWLLDADHQPYYSTTQHEQDHVSLFEYDELLSGLI